MKKKKTNLKKGLINFQFPEENCSPGSRLQYIYKIQPVNLKYTTSLWVHTKYTCSTPKYAIFCWRTNFIYLFIFLLKLQ